MLKIESAIRIDKYRPKGPTGPKNVYIFKCKTETCNNEIKVKHRKRLITATGLCVKCNNKRMHPAALSARRLRPFESLFNRVKDSATVRDVNFNLLYSQFLSFTNHNKCHYCHCKLTWKSSGTTTYNLDRKDNKQGYTVDNLVVCCGKCNKGKRELYSYEEWYGMTAFFRNA